MKKWTIMMAVLGAMPLSMMAQDDDMYFVPSKKTVENVRVESATPRQSSYTYYSGSNRDVDEYNRRGSYYQVIPGDTAANDIIDFNSELGVYPDSASSDYRLTRQMARYEGYEPGDAFWAGYSAGRRDSWGWHSPWYYSAYYPWYDSWYDPWYYGYGWYDPWHYGWYGPHHYYGWYGGYYGWGYPYYHGGGWYGGGGRLYARSHSGIAGGTINRYGRTHGSGTGYRSGSTSASSGSARYGNVRNRSISRSSSSVNNTNTTNRAGGSRSYSTSGNGGFSSSRSSSVSSGGSFGGSRSGGSFGGGRSGGGVRSGGSRR